MGGGGRAAGVRAQWQALEHETGYAVLYETLDTLLDLLQSPHPEDGKRVGSTLSVGMDLLQEWCAVALAYSQAHSQQGHPLDRAHVWRLVQERCTAVLQSTHTSTMQRMRKAVLDLLAVWQAAGIQSFNLPRAWYTQSQQMPDAQASLVLQEVLVTVYGTKFTPDGTAPQAAYFASLLQAMREGRGSVSRRSRLAMAYVAALKAEGVEPRTWLPDLAGSLVQEERGADNVLSHLVQPLLTTWPAILSPLLSALGEAKHGEEQVRALLSVLRSAKMHDLCVLVEDKHVGAALPVHVPCTLLHTCVTSASPRIQVAALALTIEAKTPATVFCQGELDVIRAFFTTSLLLPSAVARKDSIALFVKFLVRMRVVMHGLGKSASEPGLLARMHTLLEKLYATVLEAIHPGAPYPCTILGLSLLFLLLEASLPLPAPGKELAAFGLHDAVRALHKAKTTFQGHAPFPGIVPSQALCERLLYLASENTYDDVQQTATLLLIRLASIPETHLADPTFITHKIVQRSLAQVGALKHSDAYAGVQLLRAYHTLCKEEPTRAAAWTEVQRQCQAEAQGSADVSVARSSSWTGSLLDAHLVLLELALAYAEQHGVGTASQSHALHGKLAAVHLLVLSLPDDTVYTARIHACIVRTWHLTSPVLCAAAPEGAAHDDEEPAVPTPTPLPELASAMRLADDADTNAPSYQNVLSYAWRAMKEVAALHSTMMTRTSSDQERTEGSDLFLAWMLHIRHRGAFSTIYPQYEAACATLLRTDPMTTLPSQWLHRLLERLQREFDQFSTTRRSAGLGYAVLALVSAHAGKHAAPVVAETVALLLRLSKDDEAVPTIHALNVLRVLTMDSTLAPWMQTYLGEVLARAVACFGSAHWGVRNASMMLFSAVSTRYFGIHAMGQGKRSARDLATLLASSPALGAALLHTLRTESQHVQADDLAAVGHGSALYAVLLLLRNLRGEAHGLPMAEIRTALTRCTQSANWKLREEAVTCLAAVLPASEIYPVCARVLQEASQSDQNALHGRLALVKALAMRTEGAELAGLLQARTDLLLPNSCPATCAAFVDAAQTLLQLGGTCRGWEPVANWVATLLASAVHSAEAAPLPRTVLRDPFVGWLWPSVLSFAVAWPEELPLPPVGAFLTTNDDLAVAFLRVLQECVDNGTLPVVLARRQWDQRALHTSLVQAAVNVESALDARILAASLAHTLAERSDTGAAEYADALLVEALVTTHVGIRDALLPLLGLAAKRSGGDYVRGCVHVWEQCAQGHMSVPSRLSTVRALGHIYPCLDELADGSAFRLRRLVLQLLHDDDAEVRDGACALVSSSANQTRLDGSWSVFGSALLSLRAGDVQCTEHLWQTLCATNADAFAKDAWQLLSKGQRLFPSEEENQYYDRVTDMVRAHRYFASGQLPIPPLVSLDNVAAAYVDWDETTHTFVDNLQRALVLHLSAYRGGGGMHEAVHALRTLLVTPDVQGPELDTDKAPCLNIALVSDFFFPNVGGVEGHMYMIGQELLRRGHKVIVITHAYPPNRVGVRYLPSGMKVYYVPLHVLVRQDTLPNFFGLLPLLRTILVRENIQLVHAHQALSSMAHEGIFHAKNMGLKAVFSDHSLFGFADLGSILTNKLLRFALADVDHVVCVSHTGRENTVLRAGLAPSNVSTIPNAIDATHFYPVPDRAPKDHGIDLLLTTIPRLCAMHVGLTFVIGGDGPKYVDLEQMREKHRLQDRVQLVGAVRQRDVCAHLNKGHIFLNTSLTEAFGTSIIEATCAGLLVVTTRVGGIPELLPPSMIRLAEPTDEGIVRETSAAIAQIQNNLHDPMAQHRTVASIYSWSSTVERLQTAYQRAMATPPRSTSERFRRYHAAGGPIGGKIICIVVAVQILLLMALDRLWPRSSIYRARSMQKTGPTHRASS